MRRPRGVVRRRPPCADCVRHRWQSWNRSRDRPGTDLMRIVAGIAGAGLIALMLSEFFVTYLLPRRVKRDPRIARGIYGLLWVPWRVLGRRIGGSGGDTLLGFFGPLGALALLSVIAIGLVS